MRKFSKVVVPICISIGLPVAPHSLTFVVVSLFHFSHFSGSSSLGFQFAFLCLMTNDAEHYLTCMFYICRSPFVKRLCLLPILKIESFVFLLLNCKSLYIFWDLGPLSCVMNIYSHVLWIFTLSSLPFFSCIFLLAKGFIFDEVQFFHFFPLWLVLSASSLKLLCWSKGCEDLYFFPSSFVVLAFIFGPMIHFKLIFVYSLR